MSVNVTKKYLRISVGNFTQHVILPQSTKLADRYIQNIITREIILFLTVLPLQAQEVVFVIKITHKEQI